MLFGVLMAKKKPKDPINAYYLFVTSVSGFEEKIKLITYPNLESVTRLVHHIEYLSISKHTENFQLKKTVSEEDNAYSNPDCLTKAC